MDKCDLLELHRFLGKKWTYGMIFNIDEHPINYNKLNTLANREINPSILSERLKEFIRFNIIKVEYVKNKKCYVITDKGNELKKLLYQIKKLSNNLNCEIPKECREGDCSGCGEFNKSEDRLNYTHI